MPSRNLRQAVEQLYDKPASSVDPKEVLRVFRQLKKELNAGTVRAAEIRIGTWSTNLWVKKGILLAFRFGKIREIEGGVFRYFDKEGLTLRRLAGRDGVRVVPGGSAVRDGAFIGKGVVMMPPSYVNVGAYVDEGAMIDSHALVGSCAQIGKRVHISAAAQIGGVLEPAGTLPVIIEDDVFVGGNCGVYEGTLVRRRAVLAAGVILTGGTPVYDIVRGEVYRKTPTLPLTIPEGAVVVSGNRHIHQPFAKEHRLSVYAPVIVKYRDEKTDLSTALEESLRPATE